MVNLGLIFKAEEKLVNDIINDIVEECEKQMEYIENSKRINKEVLYNSFKTIVNRVQGIL